MKVFFGGYYRRILMVGGEREVNKHGVGLLCL